MHASTSTNLLTHCPARTCLCAGNYNYGKGLPNLPVRLLSKTCEKPKISHNESTTSRKRGCTASSKHKATSSPPRQSIDVDLEENVLPQRSPSLVNQFESVYRFHPTNEPEFQEARLDSSRPITNLTTTSVEPVSSASFDSKPVASTELRTSSSSNLSSHQVGSGDGLQVGQLMWDTQLFVGTSALEDKGDFSVLNNGSEKVRCIALPLLKQRLGYLWEKRMFTDVVFIVGRNKAKIEAHRVILSSASEVFQNLLYYEGRPLIVDGKFVLYENDFSEPAFEVFVKAMYTNEIPICLTLSTALEVFYATKKYAVIFLEDQVLEHIRQLLTVSNVFEALRFSTNAIELTYLAPICWKIIEEQTAEVLEYHLDELDVHTFARILERDRLNMEEVDIFQIAVRWAANQCKLHGMKTTGKNKRQFMEPLIRHFRFTTMTPSQFTDFVIPSRVLESKEVQQVQKVFCKVIDSRVPLPYKTLPRVNTALSQVKEAQEAEAIQRDSSRGIAILKEVPKICSDSAVIAPSLSAKPHIKKYKFRTLIRSSTSKMKLKRVASYKTPHY